METFVNVMSGGINGSLFLLLKNSRIMFLGVLVFVRVVRKHWLAAYLCHEFVCIIRHLYLFDGLRDHFSALLAV